MFKSESYRPCSLCDPPVDCAHLEDSTPEQPCWGEVRIAFEFEAGDYLHACRGHAVVWEVEEGPLYEPEGGCAA